MFELLPVLLKFLPSLAGLVAGGKGEALGTIAAKVANDVLGTSDPVEVGAKLTDPNVLAAFQARLDAETQQLKTQVEDVQHARETGIAYIQAGSSIAYGPPIVTFAVLGTFACVMMTVIWRGVPPGNDIIVTGLIELLKVMSVSCVSYWMGSSSGSKRSGDAVREIAIQASAKK